ncbi:MAG: type II toxin-antitoxin system VapC family toxin [Chloroflexota bacterium]
MSINKLSKLPKNADAFVDANILVYSMREEGELKEMSKAFLARAIQGEIKAVTSAAVVMEVTHRVMVQEASEKIELKGGQLIQYLKENPEFVKTLTRHRRVATIIYNQGVSIESITRIHVHSSRVIRQSYGLMANDSLIVAFMQKQKIRHLVTNDRDFARIPEIKVWLPR